MAATALSVHGCLSDPAIDAACLDDLWGEEKEVSVHAAEHSYVKKWPISRKKDEIALDKHQKQSV